MTNYERIKAMSVEEMSDFLMDFFMKLPRGKREFVLFLLILSIISMNIIAPLITGFEMSFSLKTWYHTVSIMLFYGLV